MWSRSIASGSLSVKEISVGYRSPKKFRGGENIFYWKLVRRMCMTSENDSEPSCCCALINKMFKCLFSNNVKSWERPSAHSFANVPPTHFGRCSSVPLLLTSYLSSSFPETPASRQLGIILVSDGRSTVLTYIDVGAAGAAAHCIQHERGAAWQRRLDLVPSGRGWCIWQT